MNSYPDWCIIFVNSQFAKKLDEELQELARFFKEYAPRYRYIYRDRKQPQIEKVTDVTSCKRK